MTSTAQVRVSASAGLCPKIVGADVEFGNSCVGAKLPPRESSARASTRLLNALPGIMARNCGRTVTAVVTPEHFGSCLQGPARPLAALSPAQYDSMEDLQDVSRRYLADEAGGCAYVDLFHVEQAHPECSSASEQVAVQAAILRRMRRALQDAQATMPDGEQLVLLANNACGDGQAYGSHRNISVDGAALWRMSHEPRMTQLITSFLASSICLTGAGHIAPTARGGGTYCLAARPVYTRRLVSEETTDGHRGIWNTRHEPWTGSCSRVARSHVIFLDHTLAPVGTFLGAGMLQLVFAMIEADALPPDAEFLLAQPVHASRHWNQDPSLRVRAPMVAGRGALTAPELQRRFLTQAQQFAARPGLARIVPEADRILALWDETLHLLEVRDLDSPVLRGRLDWVLRRSLLDAFRKRTGHPDWFTPALRRLDIQYASLGGEDGLFLRAQRAGLVEPVASEAEIQYYESNPPPSTRAYGRTMLLRLLPRTCIETINWDRVRLRVGGPGQSLRLLDVRFDLPWDWTRDALAEPLRRVRTVADLLEVYDVVDALTGRSFCRRDYAECLELEFAISPRDLAAKTSPNAAPLTERNPTWKPSDLQPTP